MPLAYPGFGPVAISIMVLSLLIAELVKFTKRRYRSSHKSAFIKKKIGRNSIGQ
jgi:hypothetical protein